MTQDTKCPRCSSPDGYLVGPWGPVLTEGDLRDLLEQPWFCRACDTYSGGGYIVPATEAGMDALTERLRSDLERVRMGLGAR